MKKIYIIMATLLLLPFVTGALELGFDSSDNYPSINLERQVTANTTTTTLNETDPWWSTNFTNMQVDCPSGNYLYGFFGNGSNKCRTDTSGGSSLVSNYSNYSNSSFFWDNLNSPENINFTDLGDVNISSFSDMDIFYYNDSTKQIERFGKPTGLPIVRRLRLNTLQNLEWATDSVTVPTLSQVCGAGCTTSGHDIIVTLADAICFDGTICNLTRILGDQHGRLEVIAYDQINFTTPEIQINGTRGYMTINYTQCDVENCSISVQTGDMVSIWARAVLNDSQNANEHTNLTWNGVQVDDLTHRTGAGLQRLMYNAFATTIATSTGVQWANFSTTANMLEPRIMIEVKR